MGGGCLERARVTEHQGKPGQNEAEEIMLRAKLAKAGRSPEAKEGGKGEDNREGMVDQSSAYT